MLSFDPTNIVYPYLNKRVYAASIDALLLVLGLVSAILFVGQNDLPSWSYLILCALVSLIEPILVSTTGGSIGHHIFGIKVIDESSGNHIGIVRALFRTITRFMFGTFSLVFIHTTKRYQALHDLAANSLVIVKNPSSLPAKHYRREQSLEEPLYRYPSLWKRGLIICLYAIISVIALAVISSLLVPESCLLESQCSDEQKVIVAVMDLIFFVIFVALMILGVKGRLWGAKREKLNSAQA